MGTLDLSWQPSLLDAPGVEIDPAFHGLRRRELTEGAWVDHAAGWCRGADELFARLLAGTPWAGREVWMYERYVPEPRLTHRWRLGHGPEPPSELREMAHVLSERYGVAFTQVGVNLYRDGTDSVAWHGDRVARELPEAVVALVSLGAPRPFRLRPTGGGASIGYLPGPGDLLVMGGSCQRTWQHAVPKARSAGPRISIQFRHAYPR
ncbi:alpha-ketoglutarate-dependent dioxygenase AlkB [Pseudonocardia nigra]|uniref:alpha-ketoglutarate-dependent dioxygenase AlkB n=1 Tax=Pseudonocardia nigra TaxID=1921578 RepID=UPI001C5EF7F8|nr:alpha-ketoglutarate-dependent dioxygenase AlkB [Pseudonocardia nigra]